MTTIIVLAGTFVLCNLLMVAIATGIIADLLLHH